MSKNKTIESEELIKYLDEYRFKNPQTRVKIPEFTRFLENKGYAIKAYTVRRDEKFREYLEKVNANIEEAIASDLVTYQTINVDDFLLKNNTKDKLKKALLVRDQYYASVAANAVNAIKQRKNLEKENSELLGKIADLEAKIQNNSVQLYRDELKVKNKAIKALKDILDTYIYPDAANALLEQAGVYEVVSKIIPTEIMAEKTINADTDIKKSKFSSINKLIGEFENE